MASARKLTDASRKRENQTKIAKRKVPEPNFKSPEFIDDSSSDEKSRHAAVNGTKTDKKKLDEETPKTTQQEKAKKLNGGSVASSGRKSTGTIKQKPSSAQAKSADNDDKKIGLGITEPKPIVNGGKYTTPPSSGSEAESEADQEHVSVGAQRNRGGSNEDAEEGDELDDDELKETEDDDMEESSEAKSQDGMLDLEAEEASEEEDEEEDEDDVDAESLDGHRDSKDQKPDAEPYTKVHWGSDSEESLQELVPEPKAKGKNDAATGAPALANNRDTESRSSRDEKAKVSDDDASSAQQDQLRATPPRSRKVPTFTPPAGFTAAKVAVASDTSIQDLLSTQNLEGKEVWQMTAPSFLPISLLESVSLESLNDGSRVLSHDGKDFGLVSQSPNGSRSDRLFAPRVAQNDYFEAPAKVSRVLHIQQIFNPPSQTANLVSPSARVGRDTSQSRKEPSPELKMRCHGFGIPGATFTDSEVDSGSSEPETTQSSVNPSLKPAAATKSKKRKLSDVGSSPPASLTPSSPTKRSRSAAESHTPALPSPTRTVNTPFYTPKEHPTSSLSKTPKLQISTPESSTNTPSRPEAKEERRKRKDEKHQKKLLQPFRVPRSTSPSRRTSVLSTELNNKPALPGSTTNASNPPKAGSPEKTTSPAKAKSTRGFVFASKIDHMQDTSSNVSSHKSPEKSQHRRARKEEKRREKEEEAQRRASEMSIVSTSSLPPASEQVTSPSKSGSQPLLSQDLEPKMDIDVDPILASQSVVEAKDPELTKAERKQKRKEEKKRRKEEQRLKSKAEDEISAAKVEAELSESRSPSQRPGLNSRMDIDPTSSPAPLSAVETKQSGLSKVEKKQEKQRRRDEERRKRGIEGEAPPAPASEDTVVAVESTSAASLARQPLAQQPEPQKDPRASSTTISQPPTEAAQEAERRKIEKRLKKEERRKRKAETEALQGPAPKDHENLSKPNPSPPPVQQAQSKIEITSTDGASEQKSEQAERRKKRKTEFRRKQSAEAEKSSPAPPASTLSIPKLPPPKPVQKPSQPQSPQSAPQTASEQPSTQPNGTPKPNGVPQIPASAKAQSPKPATAKKPRTTTKKRKEKEKETPPPQQAQERSFQDMVTSIRGLFNEKNHEIVTPGSRKGSDSTGAGSGDPMPGLASIKGLFGKGRRGSGESGS